MRRCIGHRDLIGLPLILLLQIAFADASKRPFGVPDSFVEVRSVIPDIVVELRYFGSDNFLGRPVLGYTADRCWMTKAAAARLARIQSVLKPLGLGLKIFDAYRPQRAVDDFMRWTKEGSDPLQKAKYFPNLDKPSLVKDGYIAEKSGHSRGSSVDLTLIAFGSEGVVEFDMGTAFDFFGVESWGSYPNLTAQQKANRLLLKTLMEGHGFQSYAQEWWHFRLLDEPFSETYFDFPTGGFAEKIED